MSIFFFKISLAKKKKNLYQVMMFLRTENNLRKENQHDAGIQMIFLIKFFHKNIPITDKTIQKQIYSAIFF